MSHGIRYLVLPGLLAASAAFASAAQASSDPAFRYHITGEKVGSMLAQPVITGPLPFDSTYGTLTADQKAVLFDEYESLSPGDEPPYPRYGLRHIVKNMVPFAELNGPIGPLVAVADVDAAGRATAVTVYRSPDPELTRIVSAALNFEQYKPATCKGQPCRMQFVLRVNFPDRRTQPISNLELQHDTNQIMGYWH